MMTYGFPLSTRTHEIIIMSSTRRLHQFLPPPSPATTSFFLSAFLLFSSSNLFHFCLCDVGTASQYNPPYTPTACFGNDATQFPTSNLFASAGEGIWDNGGACGRLYLVRCISAVVPRTCIPGQTIQVKIIDRALTSASKPLRPSTTMVLSTTAFGTIADPAVSSINVEFQQV